MVYFTYGPWKSKYYIHPSGYTPRSCHWGEHFYTMTINEPYFIGTDEEGKKCHKYESPDGTPLDGVTGMISIALGLPTGSWLKPYADRGTNVDMACQFYDEGDLREETLCPTVAKYVEQYKLALKHHNIKVLQHKIKRFLPDFGIAGELDEICIIDNAIGPLDLKTTKEKFVHHKWQTAPYLKMVEAELAEKYPGMRQTRWALYLREDSFELEEHTGQDDFGEFLILRESAKIKIRNGYSTKRKQCEWDL